MRTIRLGDDPEARDRAAALLRDGQLVAIPTETVYGLAADARNADAVAGIYHAKGRPSFNPLIVHVATLDQAARIGRLDGQALTLARHVWPGALTLVLPLRPDAGIAGLVTAGLDSVAIRVPAHRAARAILTAFDGPLAAPSANASGRISPTSADHVLDPDGGLSGRIAAVLDAGPCAVGVESTIIGWQDDGAPLLLRAGGIPAEAIEALLSTSLTRPATAQSHAPTAPGQMTSHYAPRASLRMNVDRPKPGETYLAFGTPGPFSLSQTGDLIQAAARLFDTLRRADGQNRPIAVAPIPDHGLGAAINDRLRRAAAPRP